MPCRCRLLAVFERVAQKYVNFDKLGSDSECSCMYTEQSARRIYSFGEKHFPFSSYVAFSAICFEGCVAT